MRLQPDRFGVEVGATLVYNGSAFVAQSNAFSRPNNVDLVTCDAHKITVKHDTIAAIHVTSPPLALPGENLSGAGIHAITRPAQDLKSTDILLRQTRTIEDSLSNPANGTAWVAEKALVSPLTTAGLINVSSDFPGLVNALANLASYYRLSEPSGATLDDATAGSHDGAVVGTPAAYSVPGGLGAATDLAITTTGVSANELTFPITGTGVSQSAFSVVARLKLPSASTVAFRDATTTTGTGYFIASDGGSPAKIQYRMGDSGSTYTTTTLWSALADNAWHTLILTKGGANTALYLDGVLIDSRTNAGSTALVSPWHVGRNGTGATYYVVTLSEFATASRAITATEARDLSAAAEADGVLHVTHEDIGSTLKSGIRLTAQGTLRPVLIPASVTATGFDVEFVDDSGAHVLAASTHMAFGISREVRDIEVNPTALTINATLQKTDPWATAVAALGPILWARLGESSGTSFNDEIGTNDGTSTPTVTLGATGSIDGDANTAVTFDGAQGKIVFANPALTGPFSIHARIRCTGAGSVGNTQYGAFIGWATSSTGSPRRLMVDRSTGLLYAETGGAVMTSAAGVAPINVFNSVVYTWDGTTQRFICNGVVVAEAQTASVSLNSALILGAFSVPSANYSFKGDIDELIVADRAWTVNEAQQLHVTATNTVIKVDRANQAQIGFRGLFETEAPPPTDTGDTQTPPTATALPAGDAGGAVTSYISLAAYRGDLEAKAPYAGWSTRALPATQGARDAIELNGLGLFPNATSANWKNHFCAMVGEDPTTGATVAPTQGTSANSLYIRVAGEYVYIVDDNQPQRTLTDTDTSVSGWASQFNTAEAGLGGIPIPADALPHSTGDRYCFVYKPPDQWWTVYAFSPATAERATTTLTLTGSPSTGGFFGEFDYLDCVNQNVQTFFLQTPVLYNWTASQLQAAIIAAKNSAGTAFGSTRANSTSVLVTGGPLNVAPLVCSWPMAAALRPVGWRFTNNFMNSGSVAFAYENADAWGNGRLMSVTDPSLTDGHVPRIGPGALKPATSAATRIDWMPLIIDWDEYNTAYNIGIADGWDAPGTDLGHIIPMSIGNCGTGAVYPATAGDGTLSNADMSKIVEGALITFRVDSSAAGIDPVMMPMYNTIKRYGVIPIDKTGGGAEVIFRNWQWPGQTRAFPGPAGFNFSTTQRPVYMHQLPWHQMQIIDPVAVEAGW